MASEQKLSEQLQTIIDQGFDVNVPTNGYPGVDESEQIGRLHSRIRSGQIIPPESYRKLLDDHGFIWNPSEHVWIVREHQLKTIIIDQGFNVNVPASGYPGVEGSKQVGQLLSRIRAGQIIPPESYLRLLHDYGFE